MTRREAREAVFGLLFESEFRKEESAEEIYYSSVENREIGEDAYIKKAYFTVVERKDEIDTLIGKHSNGWKTGRLTVVSRSVLRLCVYEMLYEDGIPYNVSINEAVELSKKYDDEKARPFVNGVLNSIKNELEGKGGSK
jgi:N utilization substance protein B